MGLSRGFPDLILFLKGKQCPIFVEFKSLKGRQSKEQKLWQEHLENRGMKYFIIRSVTDFVNLLNSLQ